MAEEQTAGRGRRGRSWHSPAGANLYCSLGWRFELALDALSGLSLAVGAMLAEAIAAAYDAHLALKWPNDLYHAERKLGGVLIEMLGERDGHQHVVVGVDQCRHAGSALRGHPATLDGPVHGGRWRLTVTCWPQVSSTNWQKASSN